jgi:hypothetical protein
MKTPYSENNYVICYYINIGLKRLNFMDFTWSYLVKFSIAIVFGVIIAGSLFDS